MKSIILVLSLLLPWPVQAALLSQNLGSGAYTASQTLMSSSPEQAFDGDSTTSWNSGVFPVQWIEVDLGQAFDISNFDLIVTQSPAPAETTHDIWLSSAPILSDLSGATKVHTIQQVTDHLELLMVALATPVNAQYVQVRTSISPSWVAWREIQVFGDTISAIPVPAAVWLFGTALLGLIGLGRHKKGISVQTAS